jgi:hypothetical protein
MTDTVGSESIFIGESAEERNRKREALANARFDNLKSIKRLTERLKVKEPQAG